MNKQTIIIISVAVIVLFILLLVTYKTGESKGFNPSTVKIPERTFGGYTFSQEEKDYLQSFAISLHNDMDGANLTRNNILYEDLSIMSDNELIAVSNVFNHLFQADSESFYNWLNNEFFSWTSWGVQDKVDTVLQRLIVLGVS